MQRDLGATARRGCGDPQRFAQANGAIESFVAATAIELPRGQRISAVSSTVFDESLDAFGDNVSGFDAVLVSRTAAAYVRSIEGRQNGRIYRAA